MEVEKTVQTPPATAAAAESDTQVFPADDVTVDAA